VVAAAAGDASQVDPLFLKMLALTLHLDYLLADSVDQTKATYAL
jgi:hypothetical protein